MAATARPSSKRKLAATSPIPTGLRINVSSATSPWCTPCGRYQLRQPLGRGTEGQTWTADDRLLERIAVKIVQPEHVPRYERLQATLMKLNHPNVVRTRSLQIEEATGRCFQLMDLHDCDLYHLIRCTPKRRLRKDLARRYTKQLASALNYMHSRDLVHCDVKLENVLLDLESNRVLLCDFGSTLRRDPGSGDPGRVHSPAALSISGSASYLAPELLLGQPLTPAADSWALGILLFTMVTGRLPWDIAHKTCASYVDWLAQPSASASTRGPRSRDSAELRSLLRGLLTPNVAERLTIAEALRHPFLSCSDGSPIAQAAQLSRRAVEENGEAGSMIEIKGEWERPLKMARC